MKRFIPGEDRSQSTLFPESLDEYISEDNPVRMVECFVEELDLGELGFNRVEPSVTGRPGYHPSTLLKIYIYGYLNRIHSSRRLEKESQRNVELMWLTRRLSPDFKTIADFRKDNGRAISKVCGEFVMICRQLNLFTQAIVAIDGSKFKAVNNRDKNFTSAKMIRRLAEVEKYIARYLAKLDKADRQNPAISEGETQRFQDKLTVLKEEMQRLKKLKAQMEETPDKQVSLTDPDARSMKTRGQGIVGYNVQTAVEPVNHLIVAHEVTNSGSDRDQLCSMAKQAHAAMGTDSLEALADKGYFKGQEIVGCVDAGIAAIVPKPLTSGSKAAGRYGKQDFQYIKQDDEYRCPANQRLSKRFSSVEKGMKQYVYQSSACHNCEQMAQCTTGKERRIKRWEHEGVLDAMQDRLNQSPEKMLLRKQTVEHPFGTLKAWMGATHFQMKTLKHVSTEMSLHVLAYNMKRVMSIMGVMPLLEAIQA